jgi:pimeloyl-ACP methyl ester carboxylesterase
MKYEVGVTDFAGCTLDVLQELPDKGDKLPTIVMVPGFGVDLHELGLYDDVARILVKNGFNIFRFSFEGTGESEGDFVSMTIESQARQVHDIMEYVKKDRFTDITRIGLLAYGFGASVTAAALPMPEITSLLFASAISHPEESFSKRFKRQRSYNPEGISEMERTNKEINRIGPAFWASVARHNLVGQMAKVTQPMLFIHGSKDRLAKGYGAQQFFDAVPGEKRFHIIELAGHSFSGKFRPVFLDLIADWFNETLR